MPQRIQPLRVACEEEAGSAIEIARGAIMVSVNAVLTKPDKCLIYCGKRAALRAEGGGGLRGVSRGGGAPWGAATWGGRVHRIDERDDKRAWVVPLATVVACNSARELQQIVDKRPIAADCPTSHVCGCSGGPRPQDWLAVRQGRLESSARTQRSGDPEPAAHRSRS